MLVGLEQDEATTWLKSWDHDGCRCRGLGRPMSKLTSLHHLILYFVLAEYNEYKPRKTRLHRAGSGLTADTHAIRSAWTRRNETSFIQCYIKITYNIILHSYLNAQFSNIYFVRSFEIRVQLKLYYKQMRCHKPI